MPKISRSFLGLKSLEKPWGSVIIETVNLFQAGMVGPPRGSGSGDGLSLASGLLAAHVDSTLQVYFSRLQI